MSSPTTEINGSREYQMTACYYWFGHSSGAALAIRVLQLLGCKLVFFSVLPLLDSPVGLTKGLRLLRYLVGRNIFEWH